MMTINNIREFYSARPFNPFIIHLADGRNVLVSHPEWMSFSPSGRSIVVHGKDDSFKMIDTVLITELEVKSSKQKKRK